MNKSISQWIKKYGIHLLIWSLFISYEIAVIGLYAGKFGHPISYLTHYLLIIATFYLFASVLLPWAVKNPIRAVFLVPLILAGLLMGYVLSNFYLDKVLLAYKMAPDRGVMVLSWKYAYQVIYRCVYILGFSTAYYFLSTYLKERNRSEELERQRLHLIIEDERMKRALSKAHNDFLKAQINPHFLFNTLDYVYQNIYIGSPDAAEAIMTLSEMMRYAVDSNEQNDFILLGDEMEQVEKLIYLYQLRKNMELNIILDFSNEAAQLRFIPLVLMTMVENIFKHGNVADDQIGIQISVRIVDQSLEIETKNALNYHPKPSRTGSGTSNIRERLQFAYGKDIYCSFKEYQNSYVAKISVPLIKIEQQRIRKGLLSTAPN